METAGFSRPIGKCLLVMLLLPLTLPAASALACSSCVTDATESSPAAYQATALLMGELPLLIIGAFCWWYRAKNRPDSIHMLP